MQDSITVSKKDKIDLKYKILDNVHGFIWYTEAEREIIDSLLFRRLQSIKQLSLVDWIFPGSEHTRFIHSIGVMYIADKMALALKLDVPTRKLVRLAALLHDIGHYPLSHLCESAYQEELISSDTRCLRIEVNKRIKDEIDGWNDIPKTDFAKTKNEAHHESVSTTIIRTDSFIKEIIEKECSDFQDPVEIVCDMIIGNYERFGTDPVLVQILHSEIDADGIDYLLRDAVFSGTSFGSFEVDMLIRNMYIAESRGRRIICIKEQGIPAADQYLINKFFSYSQVIFNKHTAILEWMAGRIVSWLRQESVYFPELDTLTQDWIKGHPEQPCDDFLCFDDAFFWKALLDSADNSHRGKKHKEIIYLSRCLLKRKELDYVDGSEVRMIIKGMGNAKDSMQNTIQYKELECDSDSVALLLTKPITSHVPIKLFREAIDSGGGHKKQEDHDIDTNVKKEEEIDIDKAELHRLYNGAAVVNADGEIELLCENHQSLMQHLYEVKLVIFRQYHFQADVF